MEGAARTKELVPALEGSALALALDEVPGGGEVVVGETESDVLFLVRDGSGTLALSLGGPGSRGGGGGGGGGAERPGRGGGRGRFGPPPPPGGRAPGSPWRG